MSKKRLFLGLGFGALLLGVVGPAQASLTGVALGTVAPPSTLGGYSMTEFGTSGGTNGTSVSSLSSGTGFTLSFSPSMTQESIGHGWATWSHGYGGNVYTTGGASETLSLTPNAGAFYVYAEPNLRSTFTVTATAQDGTKVTESIDGNGGASGIGFYGTGGSYVASVTINVPSGAFGFALGEFGVAPLAAAVPEPTSFALLGIATVGLAGYGWRRRKVAMAE